MWASDSLFANPRNDAGEETSRDTIPRSMRCRRAALVGGGQNESAVGLRLIEVDLLERDRAVIVLSEGLSHLKSEIDSLHIRITHLENHISHSSAKARFLRFLSFMKKPVPLTASITGLLLIFYLLLRSFFMLPQYAEILLSALAIVGVSLTVYQIIKPSKPEGRKK